MFCTSCGQRLSETARFCPACGAPVEGVNTTVAMPRPEQTSVRPPVPTAGGRVGSAPAPSAPAQQRSRRRHDSAGATAAIVVAALVAVAAAAALAIVMFDPFGGTSETAVVQQPAETQVSTVDETEDDEPDAQAEPEPDAEPEMETATETEPDAADASDYILADSSTRLYTADELSSLSAWELYIARNEIYARHGRRFNNEDLKAYFASKSWYEPLYEPDEFDARASSVLNETEKRNIETILALEQ